MAKARDINSKTKVYDMHVFRSESNFVTAHKDCIKVWGPEKKPVFEVPKAHSQPIACVRVTQDENYMVTTSMDNCLKVWDIR